MIETNWKELSKALSDVDRLKENINSSTEDMLKLIDCVSHESAPVWANACSGNANLQHGKVTQFDLAAYAVLGFLWGWRAAQDRGVWGLPDKKKEEEKWDTSDSQEQNDE